MIGLLSFAELQTENERLRAENTQLRSILEQNGILLPDAAHESVAESKIATEQHASVTKRSSAADKIALFRSFFRGREDVFARRWYSKTTEKSGYQPVCGNEWEPSLCNKRKFKCSA